MDIDKLEKILRDNYQPKFRLEQIKKAVFSDGISSFSEISNIPKGLRKILEEKMGLLPFRGEKILISADKLAIKAILKLDDGKAIETVLISPKPSIWSACISSQVGCSLNCAFCATGKMGFKRNLTSEEITSQILFWKQYLRKNKIPAKLSNIVFMGMGEPFLNWKEVKRSLNLITDKKYFNLGSRSVSLSTVGLPGSLEKLARDFPQVNLAISLHFSKDKLRSQFMPINKRFNLQKLKAELETYFEKCRRKVFIEYILLRGINDEAESAQDLISYLKSFRESRLLHVNLISYNETSNKLKHSSPERTLKFKGCLIRNGIRVTIRKSLGRDIQGACGQLAGNANSFLN